jgi:hypothetical protein
MIGEIKKIDMMSELLSVSKFVLMSAFILVPCVVFNQVTGGRKVSSSSNTAATQFSLCITSVSIALIVLQSCCMTALQ